jgi:pyridoxine 4-dehydrogenase
MSTRHLGGTLTLAKDLTLSRIGYGAMQLAGPGVWEPPRDRGAAIAVLREAVTRGITHIDTSDYYGPHIVNELIREALHPYPKALHIVTKVGARRAPDKSWPVALSREELTTAVHDNLKHLGLDMLDVVNLRVGGVRSSRSRLDRGTVHHPCGVAAARPDPAPGGQQRDARAAHRGQSIAPVVCVQNNYNVASRYDSELVDRCARDGIAYTPFFPLGGFTPLQSAVLDAVAARLGASPRQVALAWLLQHSPTILLIPGTSSVAHLRENIAAADIKLPADAVTELDRIGTR